MRRAFLLMTLLVPVWALAEEQAAAASATTPPPTPPAEGSSQPGTDPVADQKKAVANPLANAVQARTPEEQAAQSGFQIAVTLDHYLGAGTFVDPKLYSSLSGQLTIAPQYLFSIGKQRLVASATLRGGYEYTLPDTETGRRWSLYDTRLGVSAPALFKEKALTKISFSPSLGVVLPTSPESWNAGLIASISLGVTASRSVGSVDFRTSVSGARAIYGKASSGYRNPLAVNGGKEQRDANGNLLAICRGNETLCANAGMNPAWSFSASASIQWRATGSFLLYIGYTYLHSWRTAADGGIRDEYTSPTLTADGQPAVKTGLGDSDRTVTFFGGSYQLNEHYSIDLGIYTVQTPLFPDNKTVRFPFLSFGSWADNGSSLFFTLSAAY